MIPLLFYLLIFFIVLSVPIGIAIGLSSLIVLLIYDYSPFIIIQRMFAATNSFSLLAIPFFMLTGYIMERSGITNKIVEFANALVGFLPGGLSAVNIVTSMFFGGISGSAVADTSAVGSLLIPAMEKSGYSKSFSAAVTASSSPIGIVIPPSIPLVVYGYTAGLSISTLFLAGIGAGLLIGLTQIFISTLVSVRRGYKSYQQFNIVKLIKSFLGAFWALLTPIIIIGGILLGIFTATEAAVIAVVYSLFVSLFIYRTIKLKDLYSIFHEAARPTAIVMFIIATASGFAWVLTTGGVSVYVMDIIGNIEASKYIIVLAVAGIMLIVGTFLETMASVILFTPILAQIPAVINFDPFQFAVIIIAVLAIGLITPPVGMCLFIAGGIARMPFEKMLRDVVPFFIGLVVCVVILIFVPWITSFLIP